MSMWSKTYRLVWAIVVGCLVVILLGLCLTQYYRLREMQKDQRARQEENRQVDNLTKELHTNQERFKNDPAFVERTAREMGMIKPDELVFKVTNRNTSAEPPVDTAPPR